MKITELNFENYKIFQGKHSIKLDPHVTVFSAVNGSGKTSILNIIDILLSHYVSGLIGSSKRALGNNDINVESSYVATDIKIETEDQAYNYGVSRVKNKTKTEFKKIDLSDIRKLTTHVKDNSEDKTLFVYYPTTRVVADTVKRKTKKINEHIWEDAFRYASGNSISNFRSFFNWFLYRQEHENSMKSEEYDNIIKEFADMNKIRLMLEQRILNESEKIHKGKQENIDLIKTAVHNKYEEVTKDKKDTLDLYKDILEQSHEMSSDMQLWYVKEAIEGFLPNYTELSIKRNPLRMVVNKKNNFNYEEFNIEQLSDGEKCYISLVGDIARRLTILHDGLDYISLELETPLHGKGIILIDEIELHLHPKWQREIINRLTTVFPNCQFILTTHSPQVLGELQPEQVFYIDRNNKNDIHIKQAKETYGKSSNDLLGSMGATTNTSHYITMMNKINDLDLTDSQFDELTKSFLESFPYEYDIIQNIKMLREFRKK